MNAKIVLVLSLVAMVMADGPRYRPSPRFDSASFESFESYRPRPRYDSHSFESYESDEAQYDFDWAVQHGPSRNDYGHQESRDGDRTQGSYYVQLPDGRRQTVTYGVQGGSGYIADVQYDGQAHYDSDSYESRSFESYERPSFESFESFESYGRPRYYG